MANTHAVSSSSSLSAPGLSKETEAGQALYTNRTLSLYDIVVLGISNRFIWKCPTPHLVDQYNANLTANHLDVGVGTGYYLDKAVFPSPAGGSPAPRVVLFDLNQNSLDHTARRIARYNPETYRINILEKVEGQVQLRTQHPLAKFDSVGLSYLFHCLPGSSLKDKAVVFDNLLPLMNDKCVVFGSTILGKEVPRSWFARKLMAFYNGKGIFGNVNDGLEDLQKVLIERFNDVKIEVKGCVAVFVAKRVAR